MAWSQVIGRMLFVGGTTGTTGQLDRLNMYSYSPQDGWVDLEKDMNGQVPEAHSSACFVPAYGGSNMILFGGFKLGNASVHPNIYVLDVATMKWTRGLDVALNEQSVEAACTFSNDQFIAWDGRATGKPLNSTVVYNLKTSRWVPLYTAPEHLTATNGTPSTPSPSGFFLIEDMCTATVPIESEPEVCPNQLRSY